MRRADPVALPDGQRGCRHPADREPVGQHVGRADVEPGQRPAHAGHVAHVQSQPVDLPGRDHHDRRRGRPGQHLVVHPVPRGRGQQLGVGEARHLTAPPGRQHHGGHDQRTGAGAATRLVGAGDGCQAGPLQRPLVGVEPTLPADDEPLDDTHLGLRPMAEVQRAGEAARRPAGQPAAPAGRPGARCPRSPPGRAPSTSGARARPAARSRRTRRCRPPSGAPGRGSTTRAGRCAGPRSGRRCAGSRRAGRGRHRSGRSPRAARGERPARGSRRPRRHRRG